MIEATEVSTEATKTMYVCNKCGTVVAELAGVSREVCNICGGTFVATEVPVDTKTDVEVVAEAVAESPQGEEVAPPEPRRIRLEQGGYLEMDKLGIMIRRMDGEGGLAEVRGERDGATFDEWAALFVEPDPKPEPENLTIRGDDYMDVLGQVVALLEETANCKLELAIKFQPKHVGRNAPCPCGSELKFKKCCLNKGGVAPTYKTIPRDHYAKTSTAVPAIPVAEQDKKPRIGGQMRGLKTK